MIFKQVEDHQVRSMAISTAIYLVAFFILYYLTGTTIGGFFILIPTICIAMVYGTAGGLLGAFGVSLVNFALDFILVGGGGEFFFQPLGRALGYTATLVVGFVVGRLSDKDEKYLTLKKEVEMLREALIPRCPVCKRIWDENGFMYDSDEHYIQAVIHNRESRIKQMKKPVMCDKCKKDPDPVKTKVDENIGSLPLKDDGGDE